jgi:hypothetical protein
MRYASNRATIGALAGARERDVSVFGAASWQGRIPVGEVDVLLPLFGATMPAPLLPERPAPREFFEPVAGLAMREMFETAVFGSPFDPAARQDIIAFSRAR